MSEPDNTHAVTWTNRSTMTPADVIHDSLMDTFVGMYDDGPNSRDCQTAADGIMRDLRDEYDTITLNGQRYLLLPEPSPNLEAAA